MSIKKKDPHFPSKIENAPARLILAFVCYTILEFYQILNFFVDIWWTK
jgi:hypothetical protein